MKVLLVWPPAPQIGARLIGTRLASVTSIVGSMYCDEPLALEYLASVAKDFGDVKLLDMRWEDGFNGLRHTLETFQPNVVATTGLTVNVNECRRICHEAKGFDRRILTVVGGHHATVAPEDFVDDAIDIIAVGWEGVFTFRDILDTLRRSGSFGEIKGIGMSVDGRVRLTAPRPSPKLSEMPRPDRSVNSHLRQNYSAMGAVALVRGASGCPRRCDFCADWVAHGGKFYTLEPELVVEELMTVQEEVITWSDGDLFADRKRALRLAQLIKEAGIKKTYALGTRADCITECPDLVEKWKEIGATQVFMGLEARTDKDLNKMRKGTSVRQNEEAIHILKANELNITANFIVDLDYDSRDFKELADYVPQLELDSSFFPIMTPLPGTEPFRAAKHRFIVDNWAFWDCSHAVVLPRLGLKEFYSEWTKLQMEMWAPRFAELLAKFGQNAEALQGMLQFFEEGAGYADHLSSRTNPG